LTDPILVPNLGDMLTEESGAATLLFHTWMEALNTQVADLTTQVETNTADIAALAPLTGTGTPEAVVTADPGRWYVDTAVAAGTGIYFKETGTGDTGWVTRS
jgi:hypothetical protein